MPKKPYTTDGMPASRLMTADSTRRGQGDSRMREDGCKYPSTPPTSRAPTVAVSVPTIMVGIP